MHLAMTAASNPTSGTNTALWICFGLSTGGLLIAVAAYALGHLHAEAPRIEEWFSRTGAQPRPPTVTEHCQRRSSEHPSR